MPDNMSEVGNPRMRQRFKHADFGAVIGAFDFETMKVHVDNRRELVAPDVDRSKVWVCPSSRKVNSKGRRVFRLPECDG